MIARADVVTAVATELDAEHGVCRAEHAAIGQRVADRLGLMHPTLTPSLQRGRVHVFVRRQLWFPLELASRLGGVIVCTRNSKGQRANRDVSWYRALQSRGVEIATWEWMLDPGKWRADLPGEVSFAAAIRARAVCINSEPASGSIRGTALDWRGKQEELADYIGTARRLCDQAGLELWVTSWSILSSAPTFGARELIAPAHRCIPQPYEVHGRAGPAYVADTIREWTERGADPSRVIIGRGAHELDRDDADYWRTPAQIEAHRRSTPPGSDEAWWMVGGQPPADVVDAILR